MVRFACLKCIIPWEKDRDNVAEFRYRKIIRLEQIEMSPCRNDTDTIFF